MKIGDPKYWAGNCTLIIDAVTETTGQDIVDYWGNNRELITPKGVWLGNTRDESCRTLLDTPEALDALIDELLEAKLKVFGPNTTTTDSSSST